MAPRLVKNFLDKVKGKEKGPRDQPGDGQGREPAPPASASQVSVGADGANAGGRAQHHHQQHQHQHQHQRQQQLIFQQQPHQLPLRLQQQQQHPQSYEHAIGTSAGTGTGAIPGANTNAHAQANYQMMASGYGQVGFYTLPGQGQGQGQGPVVGYGYDPQQPTYGQQMHPTQQQQSPLPSPQYHQQQTGYFQHVQPTQSGGTYMQQAMHPQQHQTPTYAPQSPPAGSMPTQAHTQGQPSPMQYPPTNPSQVTQRKPVQTTTQLPHHPAAAAANAAATAAAVAAQQAIVSPSTPQAASQVSPLSPSAVSPQTPTVTARVTIPQGTSSNDAASMILSQIVASIVTAQNSCPIHEQCDSSCSGRIGVSQYRVLPSGERVDETDLRLQAATANAAAAANTTARTTTTTSGPPVAEGPAAELHQPAVITPSTPLFTYTPIENPKAEIRLLKIKPAYARADPLDLELVPININDAPAYGALSYCWGQGAADRKVLCNGSLFMARESLEKALKRLRAGFAAGTREEYIWADAICIDQGNEEEKSHQIMLMRYIYSRAQTVYVDLGDIKGRTLNFGGVTMTWGGGGGMGQRDLLTEADSKKHPLYYKTAYLALSQPWFSRTWIIQEVTLAKRARFMFEGNVFERDDLDAVLDRRTLSEHPERMQELLSSQDTVRGFLNYGKMQEIRQLYQQQQQTDSLKMVQLTRDFAATEAKDKIYGLMALMPEYDQGAMGPYSQPLATLFRRFAALHVRYGRAVSMLDSAGIQRRRIHEYLPSWVPDWTAQSPSPKVISTLRPIRYAAGGPTIAEVALAGDETGIAGLSMRGYLVDVLEEVHEVMEMAAAMAGGGAVGNRVFMEGHARARGALDAWRARGGGANYVNAAAAKRAVTTATTTTKTTTTGAAAGEVDADASAGDRAVEEAFARLLLMDDTYTGGNAIAHSSPIHDPVATYRSALERWGRGSKTPLGGGRRMDAEETFQMQAMTACQDRSFAITRGGYVALVPRIARPGDEVVVFWGATVPYVVRRVEAGFRLVGDGYVQGIMEGEGVEGLGPERLVDVLLV